MGYLCVVRVETADFGPGRCRDGHRSGETVLGPVDCVGGGVETTCMRAGQRGVMKSLWDGGATLLGGGAK